MGEALYRVLNNKKYITLLTVTFLSSIVFSFIFCTYMLLCNIDSVNDHYVEERVRYERLHKDKITKDQSASGVYH